MLFSGLSMLLLVGLTVGGLLSVSAMTRVPGYV